MKKQETTITCELRIVVPTGSNAAAVMEYVRMALKNYDPGLAHGHPLRSMQEPTLRLVKKETTYK